jgi:O-antigen ligase
MTSTSGKLFWWSILTFAFLIPSLQLISSALLVAIFIGSFFVKQRFSFSYYFDNGWDTWLYLAVLSMGMLYTTDVDTGIRVLETSLSLFVLTMVIPRLSPFTKEKLYSIFFAFGTGLLVAFGYCMIVAITRYSTTQAVVEFYGDNLTSALDNAHPVYFAYYLILAITFGLYLIYNQEKEPVGIGIILAMLIFFFTMLLLLGSGTAIVGILFSLLYFALKFVYQEKRSKYHYLAFSLSIVFLISLFVINNVKMRTGNSQGDYWERFVLWESALKALPNWFIGVGTGDYTSVLNDYYRSHDMSLFAQSNYNAHNQFIEVLFEVGVPGFVALMIMICRPMYFAVRNQNILGFLCIFPFLIYGMTEVFLGRYQGVVFFAMLHQTFMSLYVQQRIDASLKVSKI